MPTEKIVEQFKTTDPKTNVLLERVAQAAYQKGVVDGQRALLDIAITSDANQRSLVQELRRKH